MRQAITNLVRNGGFEDAPSFVAPTTAFGVWIDGTAGGSTTNDAYRWAVSSAGSANTDSYQFDNTVYRSGSSSLKLSTLDATGVAIATSVLSITSPSRSQLIPLLPSTSYTVKGYIKTNNVTTNAAYIDVREYTGGSVQVTTTSTNKLTGTNDWTEVTATFTTNATTRFGAILLRIASPGNISDAWFDDITLDTTTPTTRSTATNRVMVRDIKSALSFAGSQYVDIGTGVNSLINTAQAYTVGQWVKPTVISAGACFIGSSLGDRFWLNFAIGGAIRIYHSQLTPTFVQTTQSFKNNSWIHVVSTFNGTTLKIYVNGSLITSQAVTGTLNLTNGFRVGSDSSNSYTGLSSGAVVYYRALTDAEIVGLYNGIIAGGSLYGSYLMSEGAGSIAYDTSGNANNGTITGATFTSDTPSKARKEVNPNLVTNGDFSYQPPFVAPTTGFSGRWVNGTAGGDATLLNNIFGWALVAGVTATYRFETDTNDAVFPKRFKISSGNVLARASTTAEASAGTMRDIGTKILPNTSYTLTGYMKTELISGTGGSAYIGVRERSGNGTGGLLNFSTPIATSSEWTKYEVTFTSASTARYASVELFNDGISGQIMDAWFADIQLRPTTATTRQLA